MKSRVWNIVLVMAMLLIPVISSATSITPTCQGPCNDHQIKVTNLNDNTNVNSNKNENTNLNMNVNNNTNRQSQDQNQGQIQGQGQGQSMELAISNPDKIEVRQLTTPDARPVEIPILQNGSVSNWNEYPEIPIDGATYLKKGEVVVKVLSVLKGWPLWRIRAENVLPKIIDNKIEGSKVRYFVIKKSAVTGLGLSVAGAASGPVGDGLGTVSAPIGWTSSTRDDEYYITFVEIK